MGREDVLAEEKWVDKQTIPTAKGSYILALVLDAPKKLIIPRFGWLDLEPGLYGYFGNAFGPGGIRARLKHHSRTSIKPHWHIDWLRQEMRLSEVYYKQSAKPLECIWVQILTKNDFADVPVPGFGASDCRMGCGAHLLFAPDRKAFDDWVRIIELSTELKPEIE